MNLPVIDSRLPVAFWNPSIWEGQAIRKSPGTFGVLAAPLKSWVTFP